MSAFVITLLSDLGTRDATVSVARAALLQRNPDAAVIDISHNVAHYDLQQAAYLTRASYGGFAPGSVHIIAVDVFAGNAPRMMLCEKDGHYFIVPDNGVIALAFDGGPDDARLCKEAERPFSFYAWITEAARAAAEVAAGNIVYFPEDSLRVTPQAQQPKIVGDGIECHILYVDGFGNVVLDMTRQMFVQLVGNKSFSIRILRDEITAVSESYGDVPAGDPLCRFNDAGFMEIALNRAPAAALLGLGMNTAMNLRYQGVKIFFR